LYVFFAHPSFLPPEENSGPAAFLRQIQAICVKYPVLQVPLTDFLGPTINLQPTSFSFSLPSPWHHTRYTPYLRAQPEFMSLTLLYMNTPVAGQSYDYLVGHELC
jgi:hypothetical protein